jgi:hypothetical protein
MLASLAAVGAGIRFVATPNNATKTRADDLERLNAKVRWLSDRLQDHEPPAIAGHPSE